MNRGFPRFVPHEALGHVHHDEGAILASARGLEDERPFDEDLRQLATGLLAHVARDDEILDGPSDGLVPQRSRRSTPAPRFQKRTVPSGDSAMSASGDSSTRLSAKASPAIPAPRVLTQPHRVCLGLPQVRASLRPQSPPCRGHGEAALPSVGCGARTKNLLYQHLSLARRWVFDMLGSPLQRAFLTPSRRERWIWRVAHQEVP